MSQLYLISPPHFNLNDFKVKLEEALSAAQIPVFQLRMKTINNEGKYINPPVESDVRNAVKELLPICKKYNTAFILNDSPKLAKELGCDGVHLGDEDMKITDARKIVGENFIIGASCYGSKDLAYEAAEQGATYVAFGQFYETKTKEPKGKPTTDLLKFWSTYTNLPCVAIGGIKVENAKPIVNAGADFIAVVTGVWNYEKGIAAAVRDFVEAIS